MSAVLPVVTGRSSFDSPQGKYRRQAEALSVHLENTSLQISIKIISLQQFRKHVCEVGMWLEICQKNALKKHYEVAYMNHQASNNFYLHL